MIVHDSQTMTWMTLRYGSQILKATIDHRPGCPLTQDRYVRWCVCGGPSTLHFAPGVKVSEAR
jgi:hypothetical protein